MEVEERGKEKSAVGMEGERERGREGEVKVK